MAGHSKFKNIMHRKGAQDAKRGKLFTRLTKEIFIAAKISPDRDSNPRLRSAIAAAKASNVPKDKIETAIAKASNPADNSNYEEIRYEGYASGGIAIIVEAMTDNKNRTVSGVRSAFTKYGGNLGESGSVSYMFDRLGTIIYKASSGSEEDFLEATIEAGGDDCTSDPEYHEIICSPANFHSVREALEIKFGTPESSEIMWRPKSPTSLNEEQATNILKLLDILEEHEDVQSVVGNFILSEANA